MTEKTIIDSNGVLVSYLETRSYPFLIQRAFGYSSREGTLLQHISVPGKRAAIKQGLPILIHSLSIRLKDCMKAENICFQSIFAFQ